MRRCPWLGFAICCAVVAGFIALETTHGRGQAAYRLETGTSRGSILQKRFSGAQLALLEKLNRADLEQLGQLPALVVPESWDEEMSYSVLPRRYPASEAWPTFVVVHLPGQLFGAYESGHLVRWGPVSSGGRNNPTSPGMFSLNWRSTGRASTVDPEWFLRWYFNFGNREGLAFHAYSLPGVPDSHGCIRLLERDAEWLYGWGQSWELDPTGSEVLKTGTPVLILGAYDFDGPPPWRSLAWLSTTVELP